MDEPRFSSIDDLINIRFDKRELERVAEIIPEEYHKELQLPLILLAPGEYGMKYRLLGSKPEVYLFQELLRRPTKPFGKFVVDEGMKTVSSISMLKQRRFKTIYMIFPDFEARDSIWLSTTYENPHPIV